MDGAGQVRLENGIIYYESTKYGNWELPLADVRVIGEFTNEMGPYEDDYFFCFVVDLNERIDISFYADGRDQFLNDLGVALGAKIELGLCNSTSLASRVLWPASIVGQALFEYRSVPSAVTLSLFVSFANQELTYAECVLQQLQNTPVFGIQDADVAYVPRRAAYVVILDGDRFLAVRGSSGYFLPGGGCEAGESFESCVAREVAEELASEVTELTTIGSAKQFLHAVSDGLHFEAQFAFFNGRLGHSIELEPEDERCWIPISEARQMLFHESHAWAVHLSVISVNDKR